MFKILDADIIGANESVTKHPPSVRDLVWIGMGQEANFKVICLPGVSPGVVDCGVRLIQASSSTRLSFHMQVVEAEHASGTSEDSVTAAVGDLHTALEEVEVRVAKGDLSEPVTSDTEHVSGTEVITSVATLHASD